MEQLNWILIDKHCEIRFGASQLFLSKKSKLHEELIRFFPLISEPNISTLLYQNLERGISLSITNTNIVLSGALLIGIDEHKKLIKSVWGVVKRILNIQKINRIGVRVMNVIQTEDPSGVSAELNAKYMGINKPGLREFHFNSVNFDGNIGVRIATSNHIYQNVDINNQLNSIQIKGILYDVDVFEEKIPSGNDDSVLSKLYQKAEEVRMSIYGKH